MKEFLLFLWDRYVLRCRNIGWGQCTWRCRLDQPKQRILIDEGMCWPCYNDYIERYK